MSRARDSGRPPIRSYVLREGRMTKGQQSALDRLWPMYGISVNPSHGGRLDVTRLFGQVAETHMEIGFGDGGALVEMACNNPHQNYLGIEVHRPGVGRVLRVIHERGLKNVRVLHGEATDVLTHYIADHSLHGINLFFPDPWPKKKHHKRRLVQPGFIELLSHKLVSGGVFHFATDWEPYAREALRHLDAAEGLGNRAGPGCFCKTRAHRPVTKFETRGQNLGHQIWDIVMICTRSRYG